MGKDYVSKSDLKRLNNVDLIPLRFRIIYNTLFFSGMRPGEILNMKVSDIYQDYREDKQKTYYFFDLKTQKNKIENELTPIRENDYISIIDYVRSNKIKTQDYIFGSSRSKPKFSVPMSVSWLGRKLKEHLQLVGISKDITPHSFRSGLVTYLREEKKLSYGEIASITRHQNINVMMKHYDKRIKHNAFDIIESM